MSLNDHFVQAPDGGHQQDAMGELDSARAEVRVRMAILHAECLAGAIYTCATMDERQNDEEAGFLIFYLYRRSITVILHSCC